MRFTDIATVVAFLASANAWVIPEGAADGVYKVSRGEDGNEVHTRVANANAVGSLVTDEGSMSSGLEARADGRIWCGCGFNMSASYGHHLRKCI